MLTLFIYVYRAMQRLKLFILSLFFLSFVLNACSSTLYRNKDKTAVLTQKAIFEYLKQPSFFRDSLIGKGLSMIDPLLSRRERLSTNGVLYFEEPMHSDLLKYPLSSQTYKLIIPDSLAGKYRYTGTDTDFEHDYSIVYQFSPLIPTLEPYIYLIEFHIWANMCDDEECVRALNREYLKFRIEESEVTFLEAVGLYNLTDFIGFGSFSKKKMEKALPGEKIVQFGH